MLQHILTLHAGTRWRRFLVRHGVPAVAVVLLLLPLVFMVTGSLRAPGLAPPTGVELLPVGTDDGVVPPAR